MILFASNISRSSSVVSNKSPTTKKEREKLKECSPLIWAPSQSMGLEPSYKKPLKRIIMRSKLELHRKEQVRAKEIFA
jgi:hypothetical protein